MAPQVAEFENPGSKVHVTNQALALCSDHHEIHMKGSDGVVVFTAKLLAVYPAEAQVDQPLVFDPPPMAA